jgi:hypothetical protein
MEDIEAFWHCVRKRIPFTMPYTLRTTSPRCLADARWRSRRTTDKRRSSQRPTTPDPRLEQEANSAPIWRQPSQASQRGVDWSSLASQLRQRECKIRCRSGLDRLSGSDHGFSPGHFGVSPHMAFVRRNRYGEQDVVKEGSMLWNPAAHRDAALSVRALDGSLAVATHPGATVRASNLRPSC